MFKLRKKQITPAQIIILGFALLILTGALLLMLPFSTSIPGGASFLDALFTTTSATCVTGLVVHDTALYWSQFGQLVILLLIQIGGMGVVTVAVAVFIFSGKKISLKQRWVMQESISAPQVGGIVRMTGFILRTLFLLEGIGAAVLAFRFCPEFGLAKGLWYSVFHSISAFCNAGFDLMGIKSPFSSLTDYTGDPVVSLTIPILIILGGIGFMTWKDVREHKWHFRLYTLQTKLILTTTAGLILIPTLLFFFLEFSRPVWDSMTLGERLLASFFQAVTPRTAGFNSVDLTALSEPSQALTIVLMLIGGAPGSTAGGFKVTALAVLFVNASAVLRHRSCTQCYGRRLMPEALTNAMTIVLMYLILFFAGGAIICGLEGIPLMDAMFETASAIGTVGLTLGATPTLGTASKLILIFLMYFGRVGGLTLIYALLANKPQPASMPPQERVTVS